MPPNTLRYFEESNNMLEGKSPESYGPEFAALMRSKLGPTMEGKPLPSSIIEYRAKMPFLHFVGRLEDKKPAKKSAGGNVERVSYDRKLI